MKMNILVAAFLMGLVYAGCVSKPATTPKRDVAGKITQDANAVQKVACRVQLDLMKDVCEPAATGKVTQLCVKIDGQLGLCAPVMIVDPNAPTPTP